jgi:hypothetical protein
MLLPSKCQHDMKRPGSTVEYEGRSDGSWTKKCTHCLKEWNYTPPPKKRAGLRR